MKILITGASGFIGSILAKKFGLNQADTLILLDNKEIKSKFINCVVKIENSLFVNEVLLKHSPDIIIHCAGIAHQKLGGVDKDIYFKVNSDATINLAKAALNANPEVHFIFLSSVCVYGEEFKSKGPIKENSDLNPSSDYAKSKLDAENKLIELNHKGKLKKLDILRLAPVYDSDWTLNLDKRVFTPKKLCFLKFGSGNQKMSAVSRKNLSDFIEFRVNKSKNENLNFCNIFNVCDKNPYSFLEIINVFKKSKKQPTRVVLKMPLPLVWFLTRLAGLVIKSKQEWIYSCYDKVAKDLVFDNSKMLETGFVHKHNLKNTF